MNTAQDQAMESIREMARRIVEACCPERIILFGSQAREGADGNSDADLLVVTNYHGTRRELVATLYDELRGMGMAKDIVVATPDEFTRYRNIVGTIVHPAAREGKVLYERAS
jgi:predicted nucleotidyltransferase